MALSKSYCSTFSSMGNALEKLQNYNGSEDLNEFINQFIEDEEQFHMLERRFALADTHCFDLEEHIKRGEIENEQFSELKEELNEREKEIVIAEENQSLDTCLMIL